MSTPEETFQEEAQELLADLEAALLELEEQPEDPELVDRVFRAMHTLKGGGGMFGFDEMASFTHHLENVFDQVRNGKLGITKELINIGLESRDHIRGLIDEIEPSAELKASGAALLKRLEHLFPAASVADARHHEILASSQGSKGAAQDITYRIRIKPAEDALSNGMDPLPILRELRSLGPCIVTSITGDVPCLDDLAPEHCYLAWDLILTTDRGKAALDDVFIFVSEEWAITVDVVDEGCSGSDNALDKPLGEILMERGDVSQEAVEQALSQQRLTGEILSDSGLVHPEKIQAALAEQKVVRQTRTERQVKASAANVKVPAEKLDILMDLVGELVIAQARLTQTANERVDQELFSIAEEVERHPVPSRFHQGASGAALLKRLEHLFPAASVADARHHEILASSQGSKML